MIVYEVVMTADGKIVTDPTLLKRFKLAHITSCFHDLQKAEQLSIILLPWIMGGHETPTITGPPSDFLKIPIEFSLVSKKVKKKVCYLRYQKFLR
ncbi:MAG: hypothetical protein ACOYK6_07775 [Chthoniobacterales bacterium]